VAATATHGSRGQQWRLSVRLDVTRASLLRTLSAEIGCPPSELLRRSLDYYAASRSTRPPAPKRPEINAATTGLRQLPIANGGSPKAASPASPEPRLTTTVRAETTPQPTKAVGASSQHSGVAELENQYRAFGALIWKERRVLFQRTVVAAKVAQANSENSKDAEIYAELLRLGQEYGLFS
jgi:hypothetical protein